MVLRKTKLTLALLASVLGFGCAPTSYSNRDLTHAQEILLEASHYMHEKEGRKMSKGRAAAIRELAVKDSRLLSMKFDGLFYNALWDVRTYDHPEFDGKPDLAIKGRWQYDHGKKVPSTDFIMVCKIKYGELYYDKNFHVQQNTPDINCSFNGRNWVTPEYIMLRMAGTDPYTTDKMRREK